MKIGSKDYTRAALNERTGNLAQVGGTRHVILNEGAAKGMAAIDVNTGGGLAFTVLPDRGLDISSASYQGLNMAYLTPNGEVHPAFYEPAGLGWLHTFAGGLLTTCGLTYLGAPGRDGDEDLGLHGRYSTIPARQVQDRSRWDGDTYRVEIVGVVEECRLFGDNLRLTRTISTTFGSRMLRIHDHVENVGFRSSPFTVLYHINLGFPLLDAGSRLVLSAAKSEANNETARAGLAACRQFTGPVPGFAEEVYLHTMRAEEGNMACAALINPTLAGGLGVRVRFDAQALPYLNEWKMMGQCDYVVGIEPCNAPCENRAVLRQRQLLPFLEPGEVREMVVEIGVLEGAAELNACAALNMVKP